MRPTSKIAALACALMLGGLVAQGYFRQVAAQDSRPVKSARGGLIAKTSHYQFEVFFYTTGVRVFAQDSTGKPLDASRLAANVTFYHPNSPNPWFSRALRAAPASQGQASPSLDLAIGLENTPATGAKAALDVSGLPESAEPKATFTVPVEFVTAVTTQPTISQSESTSVPRYSYGPGYSGYGYYQNAGPQAAPATGGSPRTTRGYAPHLGHRPSYDWSVGRDNNLAKPWLRPWD